MNIYIRPVRAVKIITPTHHQLQISETPKCRTNSTFLQELNLGRKILRGSPRNFKVKVLQLIIVSLLLGEAS